MPEPRRTCPPLWRGIAVWRGARCFPLVPSCLRAARSTAAPTAFCRIEHACCHGCPAHSRADGFFPVRIKAPSSEKRRGLCKGYARRSELGVSDDCLRVTWPSCDARCAGRRSRKGRGRAEADHTKAWSLPYNRCCCRHSPRNRRSSRCRGAARSSRAPRDRQ